MNLKSKSKRSKGHSIRDDDNFSQGSLTKRSIMSDEYLELQEHEEIKQSRKRDVEKVVMRWTQVILGKMFPRLPREVSVSYNSSQLLNSGEVPPIVQQLQGGVILKAPLQNIEQYLSKFLDLPNLLSDDELCQGLEDWLARLRASKSLAAVKTRAGRASTLQVQTADHLWDECLEFLKVNNHDQMDRDAVGASSEAAKDGAGIQQWSGMKKRDVKLAMKKQQVIEKYKVAGQRPRVIAQDLGVSKQFVYKTVEQFKYQVERHVLNPMPLQKVGRKSQRTDPKLLAMISKVLEVDGIYNSTITKLRRQLLELQSRQPEFTNVHVPSGSTILRILKETFHLKFGKASNSNPKYRDPTYNEKRLWVSRLLAQFLLEDAVVISVDESNFRSDHYPAKQWSFDSSGMFKDVKQRENKSSTQQDRPMSRAVQLTHMHDLNEALQPAQSRASALDEVSKVVFDNPGSAVVGDRHSSRHEESHAHSQRSSASRQQQTFPRANSVATHHSADSHSLQSSASPRSTLQGMNPRPTQMLQTPVKAIGKVRVAASGQPTSKVTSSLTTPRAKKAGALRRELSPIPEEVGTPFEELSIQKQLESMKLLSSNKKATSTNLTPQKNHLGLSPLTRHMAELQVGSAKRKWSEQQVNRSTEPEVVITPRRLKLSGSSQKSQVSHALQNAGDSRALPNSILHRVHDKPRVLSEEVGATAYRSIQQHRLELEQTLGKYGMQARQLSIQRVAPAREQYSMSFIAATTQSHLIASQVIEGAFDSVLFENFVYQTLRSVRTDPLLCNKKVVLLIDNARIHKFSEVAETVRKFKAVCLFSAEYSPWLNPIEQLFNFVKARLRVQQIDSKAIFVMRLASVLKAMTQDDMRRVWAFSVKKWLQTIRYGHV